MLKAILLLFARSHKDNEVVEGMCNMGISAFMGETEIIVGSPGSYEWQGKGSVPPGWFQFTVTMVGSGAAGRTPPSRVKHPLGSQMFASALN